MHTEPTTNPLEIAITEFKTHWNDLKDPAMLLNLANVLKVNPDIQRLGILRVYDIAVLPLMNQTYAVRQTQKIVRKSLECLACGRKQDHNPAFEFAKQAVMLLANDPANGGTNQSPTFAADSCRVYRSVVGETAIKNTLRERSLEQILNAVAVIKGVGQIKLPVAPKPLPGAGGLTIDGGVQIAPGTLTLKLDN